MTRDDIIRLAREAGFLVETSVFGADVYEKSGNVSITTELERFSALVAAAEREACAKIADGELRNQTLLLTDPPKSGAAWAIAAAIRARGNN